MRCSPRFRSSLLARLWIGSCLWSCLWPCLWAALVLCGTCPASAKKPVKEQKAASGKDERNLKKARDLAALGEAAKVRGNPAVALQLFQQAYDLKPLPVFLFRMAQCHQGMGNAGRAAFSYRQYLKYATDIPDRPEVEDLTRRMEGLATAVRNEGNDESKKGDPIESAKAP